MMMICRPWILKLRRVFAPAPIVRRNLPCKACCHGMRRIITPPSDKCRHKPYRHHPIIGNEHGSCWNKCVYHKHPTSASLSWARTRAFGRDGTVPRWRTCRCAVWGRPKGWNRGWCGHTMRLSGKNKPMNKKHMDHHRQWYKKRQAHTTMHHSGPCRQMESTSCFVKTSCQLLSLFYFGGCYRLER